MVIKEEEKKERQRLANLFNPSLDQVAKLGLESQYNEER